MFRLTKFLQVVFGQQKNGSGGNTGNPIFYCSLFGRGGGDRTRPQNSKVLWTDGVATADQIQLLILLTERRCVPELFQPCKKQIRSLQSHFTVLSQRALRTRTRVPTSDGGIVFSSTKINPPCLLPSSAQVLSNGGIVLRS